MLHDGFIAGFFDGDGTIAIPRRDQKKNPKPLPSITFAQSCNGGVPPELESLRMQVGGTISVSSKATLNHRCCWRLCVRQTSQIIDLLSLLDRCCIVKLPQIKTVLAYMATDRSSPETFSSTLKQQKKETHHLDVDKRRVTDSYLAGMFAADGTVGIYGKSEEVRGQQLHCRIAQLKCPPLLLAIQEVLGFGSLDIGSKHPVAQISFTAGKAMQFLKRIYPSLHGAKRLQTELALEFQATKRRRGATPVDQETTDRRNEIQQQLKKLKKG